MLALRCPQCASPLDAKAGRRVWVCGSCRNTCTTTELSGGRLQLLERRVVRPVQECGEDEAVYLLPVWAIHTGPATSTRIPAVGIDRMPLILSLAQRLAGHAGELERWSLAESLRRAPADLHAQEALELAEILAQAENDGEPVELRGGLQLEDWPCVRRSSQLVELVSGRAGSGRILEGLEPVARGPRLSPLLA